MIYDGFMFYNEWDILDIRVRELTGVVDKHLVVMGDKSFQNRKIEDIQEKEERILERYQGKAVPVIHKDSTVDPWKREMHQRDAIKDALWLMNAEPDDLVIISDADEIPRRSAIGQADPEKVTMLFLDEFMYKLNLRRHVENSIKILPVSALTTPSEIRSIRTPYRVHKAGWHFSYLGDSDWIVNKLNSYSHTEFKNYTADQITEAMNNHKAFWHEEYLERVDIDDTWPIAIKEDPERWQKYVLD